MQPILNVPNGIASVRGVMMQKKPQILLATGIGLSVGALLHAMWHAEEAAEAKQIKRIELADAPVSCHPVVERMKIELAAIPVYIPSLAMEAGAVASVIAGGKTFAKRNLAIGAACGMAQNALETYREKVREKLGENKETEIREEASQKRMMDNAPQRYDDILLSGQGDQLYFDPYSGRWFWSTDYKIHKYENFMNDLANRRGFATLNDWYDMLGLDPITFGDEFGITTDPNDRRAALMRIVTVPTSLCIGDEKEISAFELEYDMVLLNQPIYMI